MINKLHRILYEYNTYFIPNACSCACEDPEWGRGPEPKPPGNHYSFLRNTSAYIMGNHKAVQPAFIGHHRPANQNAIEMVFRWRGDDGPILVVNWSFLVIKTRFQSWTDSCRNFLDPLML